METLEKKYEFFCESLYIAKYVGQTNIVGIYDSLLSKSNALTSKDTLNISLIIKELYIVNTDTFDIVLKERFYYNTSTTVIEDVLPFSSYFKYKKDNTKESPISFDTFYSDQKLVQILNISKARLSIIGILSNEVNSLFSKSLLLHLLIAYINITNKRETKHVKAYQAVFAKCFCVPLISNFSEIFNGIMKKQELNLSGIKYKTFYLIDLSSNAVLFNLNSFHNKKNIQIDHNEGIWAEVLYHSHNLMMEYNTKNKKRYNAFYSSEYCVKLECKATYPRYIIIIKFLPVLCGLSLIHVYHQKKLSSSSEGNDTGSKSYKEYDVIYGTEQKRLENHIEFKYVEPLKIKRIEQFFVNYFITTNSINSFYYTDKNELKYYDENIMSITARIIHQEEESSIVTLIKKLKLEYYQESQETIKNDSTSKQQTEPDGELTVINFIDFLYFSKDKFLQFYNKITELNTYSKKKTITTDKDPKEIRTERNKETKVSAYSSDDEIIENTSRPLNDEKNELSISRLKSDDFHISCIKTNNDQNKSIFTLDITGIQKVNDCMTDNDNISNIYAIPQQCRNNCDGDINKNKEKEINWEVGNIPNDHKLSFKHSQGSS